MKRALLISILLLSPWVARANICADFLSTKPASTREIIDAVRQAFEVLLSEGRVSKDDFGNFVKLLGSGSGDFRSLTTSTSEALNSLVRLIDAELNKHSVTTEVRSQITLQLQQMNEHLQKSNQKNDQIVDNSKRASPVNVVTNFDDIAQLRGTNLEIFWIDRDRALVKSTISIGHFAIWLVDFQNSRTNPVTLDLSESAKYFSDGDQKIVRLGDGQILIYHCDTPEPARILDLRSPGTPIFRKTATFAAEYVQPIGESRLFFVDAAANADGLIDFSGPRAEYIITPGACAISRKVTKASLVSKDRLALLFNRSHSHPLVLDMSEKDNPRSISLDGDSIVKRFGWDATIKEVIPLDDNKFMIASGRRVAVFGLKNRPVPESTTDHSLPMDQINFSLKVDASAVLIGGSESSLVLIRLYRSGKIKKIVKIKIPTSLVREGDVFKSAIEYAPRKFLIVTNAGVFLDLSLEDLDHPIIEDLTQFIGPVDAKSSEYEIIRSDHQKVLVMIEFDVAVEVDMPAFHRYLDGK